MKTGIWGYKGRIHYQAGRCIGEWLPQLSDELPRTEFFTEVARRIDREIHLGYRLFPGNYVAHDELHADGRYAGQYSAEDKERFDAYVEGQLAKVSLPSPDLPFLRERILTMYANPVTNKAQALEAETETKK